MSTGATSTAPAGPPTGLPVLHMTNFHAKSDLGTEVDIHNLAHKLKAAERQVLPGFELQFNTVKKKIEDEQGKPIKDEKGVEQTKDVIEFTRLRLELRRPKAQVLLFPSGKLQCTGAESEEGARRALRRIAREVQRVQPAVRCGAVTISHALGTCDFDHGVNLESLGIMNGLYASFNAERGAHCTYRMEDPHCVLLIHASGKVTLSGCTDRATYEAAIRKIAPKVRAAWRPRATKKEPSAAADGGKKPRAPAAKADKGDKPKRAPSAYMNFCKAERDAVKAANPKASFGELGKLLGAAWAKLSDAEKAAYKEEGGAAGAAAAAGQKRPRDAEEEEDDDDDDDDDDEWEDALPAAAPVPEKRARKQAERPGFVDPEADEPAPAPAADEDVDDMLGMIE